MNMVDNIARKLATEAVRSGLEQMAVTFDASPDWIKAAGPLFLGVLVGKKDVPKFTADQITQAFETAGQERKTLPRPAHVADYAREQQPLAPMQKRHTDPTPQKTWTAEERARNIAFVENATVASKA